MIITATDVIISNAISLGTAIPDPFSKSRDRGICNPGIPPGL